MALLRDAHAEGRDVTEAEALNAATLVGAAPDQPKRVLDGLLADGLAVREEGTSLIGLPGSGAVERSAPTRRAESSGGR